MPASMGTHRNNAVEALYVCGLHELHHLSCMRFSLRLYDCHRYACTHSSCIRAHALCAVAEHLQTILDVQAAS